MLDVHQDVRIETGCWSPPLLCVAVGDRGVTDLLDAISSPDVGDVVSKFKGTRVGDNGLKAVLRGLGLVYCPGREIKLLGEVDVLLVLCGSTCAEAEPHELNRQDLRSVVDLEDASTLSILLAFVAADGDVGFAVIGVQAIGKAHAWSVWDGDTQTDTRRIAVRVCLLAVTADPGNLVLDKEERSELVLVDTFGLLKRVEQILKEIMAVFLCLTDGAPARITRSASRSDRAVKSTQLTADTTRRSVVAYE